jgi:hypothetical protein
MIFALGAATSGRLRFFVSALSAFPDTEHAADFAVSKARLER